VVSDWGAVNECADALSPGLELEIPVSNGIGEQKIVEAVKNGQISEDKLDRAVERFLNIIFQVIDLLEKWREKVWVS